MSLEFKWEQFNKYRRRVYEPVEVGDDFHVVLNDRSKRRQLVSNGRVAFEIISRGKLYDRLLSEYEFERRLKKEPVTSVAVEPLRQTVAPKEIVKPEPVKQVVVADAPPPVFDEQVEAEQFFEAVEPWVPDPNDFFDCTLASRLGPVAIIGELSNQQLVWIHERDITVRPSGHSVCLPKGTKTVVRLALNTKNPRFSFRALECQVMVDGEQKESHATGEITYWTGSLGSVRMDCGCTIAVGTASRDDQLDLNIRDRVEFDIVFSEKLQKFVGRDITVLGTKE